MTRLMAGVFVALCLAGPLADTGPAAAPAAAQPAAAASLPQPLADLNAAFRRTYGDARRRMLAESDPVIIAGGDTAVLLRRGHRTEASANRPLYHTLKAVAHIPLAIYVTLTPGEGPLDAGRARTLEDLRRLIPPARAGLATAGLASAVLTRQDALISQSLAFLDEVLAKRTFSRDRLRAFVRGVVQAVEANVADAARAQLDALHAQISVWRREMTPAEWDRLRVVVVGSHMPREGAVHMQYFSRLLREPAEGHRIVYAESLFDESRALDLLGTHQLDGSIGEAFFDDFMRMHRDLLADAARDHVPALLQQ